MIANADDNAVMYHFLRQVPVITSLSQVVEAGYKLLDSFILLLTVTIEFVPLKDHVLLYLNKGVKLVHHSLVVLLLVGRNPDGLQHLLRVLAHTVEERTHLLFSPFCGQPRSDTKLFKPVLSARPLIRSAEVKCGGGAADVGLPSHPTSDTMQRSSWISKHLIFTEQQ